MTELSDEVASAAARGDPAAVRTAYEQLAPSVVGYLRARGSTDAEGLAQEVFLVVFGRLDKLSGGSSGLRSLTFSIAHARLVDELRARRRQPTMIPFEPSDDHRTTESAESSVLRSTSENEVLALLASLRDPQRDVLALRVVAGLSLEETAVATGRSIGAVKQLQRRALLALRALAEERGVTMRAARR